MASYNLEDKELSIVVPFYNEEENVRIIVHSLVNALKDQNIRFELVLVNNGSQDGTDKEIDEAVKTYGSRVVKQVVSVNQGWGWGVICGLKLCKGDYVGYMVGDGEINPQDVIEVYNLARGNPHVLAKTYRMVRNDGLIRIALSRLYNAIANLLYGLRMRDINATPKIFHRDLLCTLDLESKRDLLDCELLAKFAMLGGEIMESPVVSPRRSAGRSHVNFKAIWALVKDVISFRVGGRLSSWKQKQIRMSD
jgi:glycosyltransferase involved in cell wall biosynthesis